MKSSTSIGLSATFLAVAAAIGYAVWFDRKRRKDPEFRKTLEKAPIPNAKESSPTNEQSSEDDILSISRETDLSLEQIHKLPKESRQKIFRSLLVWAETFISLSTPAATTKAIEYLYKALNLVPNPEELLELFKQNLPSFAFEGLVKKVQMETHQRIEKYYSGLLSQDSNAKVHWEHCGKPDSPSSSEKVPFQFSFRLHASGDVKAGELLFQESLNEFFIASSTLEQMQEEVCGFCCTSLSCVSVKQLCPENGCQGAYCSVKCLEQAKENYHCFFCSAEASSLFNSLSVIGKLVAKYIGMMLSQELKGHSSIIKPDSPFIHFEYMKRLVPINELSIEALKEAQIIRSIFTPINAGMDEFLTDERFSAIRATLRGNAFSIGNVKLDDIHLQRLHSCKSTELESNHADGVVFLLSTLVHLEHSCEPNAQIVVDLPGRKANLVALRDLKANERITVCWLSEEDLQSNERREIFKNSFISNCRCSKCIREEL